MQLQKATQSHSVSPSDKLAFNFKNHKEPPPPTIQPVLRAVSEGGHHVPPTLRHCPAVLLP